MRFTFSIIDSSDKAIALLEYLRTLEFVKEETTTSVLTDTHKNLLEERRNNRMTGKSKTYSWDEVKKSVGKNTHE